MGVYSCDFHPEPTIASSSASRPRRPGRRAARGARRARRVCARASTRTGIVGADRRTPPPPCLTVRPQTSSAVIGLPVCQTRAGGPSRGGRQGRAPSHPQDCRPTKCGGGTFKESPCSSSCSSSIPAATCPIANASTEMLLRVGFANAASGTSSVPMIRHLSMGIPSSRRARRTPQPISSLWQ